MMNSCSHVAFVLFALLELSVLMASCDLTPFHGKRHKGREIRPTHVSNQIGRAIRQNGTSHEENMKDHPQWVSYLDEDQDLQSSLGHSTPKKVRHEYLMALEEGKNINPGQTGFTLTKSSRQATPQIEFTDVIQSPSSGNVKLTGIAEADAVAEDTLENSLEDPIDGAGEINDVGDEDEKRDKKQRQVIAWGFGNKINKLNSFWQKWFSVKRFGQASANLAGQVTNEKLQQLTNPIKEDRLLSFFTFVKFNNTECIAATGDAGSCYTDKECRIRGGTASGSCASGFGVCCVFYMTCGGTAAENSTYFVNEGFPEIRSVPGRCQLTAIRPNNRVCQLRVDFVNFEISGPSSDTNNAQIYGQCNTDQFVVTHQTGAVTPVICGTNSGQHVYLDFRQAEQLQMIFLIGSGTSVGGNRRSWKLRITQIPCGAPYEAPSGCLQHYLGVTGRIQTFNYNDARGQQLANQDYSVCIRMDNGFCGVLYQQCADTVNVESESFSVSNVNGNFQSEVDEACVQGNAGTQDWVSIPCATDIPYSFQNSNANFCSYRQCGSYFSALSGTQGSATSQQVYSSQKPLTIYYHTDASDPPPVTPEETLRGFCLDYTQQPCPLTVGRG